MRHVVRANDVSRNMHESTVRAEKDCAEGALF